MSYEELLAEYKRLQEQKLQLDARAAQIEEKGAQLQEENARLREQLKEAEQQLAEARALIEQLRRELFGPKADRLNSEQEEQLNKLNQDLQEAAQRPAPVSHQVLEREDRASRRRRERHRGRHPLPEHLETETVTLEPTVKICSCCGKPLVQIGEEVTEEIDRVPAKLIRRRIVRPKLACRCGEGGVQIAPLPPRLIQQSRLGLGLGVHVVLSRFDDHLSFYRLEQQFRERHSILIPRQQMVQWVEPIAALLRPVTEVMWKRMLAGGYLQVDETPVRVLDPDVKGKAARGYLWFYAVPGGDVVLDFNRSRGLESVRQRLKDFAGTIQTDAYEVYQSLERKEDRIQRIGCVAHSRRRFYDALKENLPQAVWFINQIRLLYRIEDQVRELTSEERRIFREHNAKAIWEELKEKAQRKRQGGYIWRTAPGSDRLPAWKIKRSPGGNTVPPQPSGCKWLINSGAAE